MKLVGLMTAAVLSLTLVAAAPVFAQEQHEEEQKAKPAQEEKAQPEKAGEKKEQKPEVKAGREKRAAGKEVQAGREEARAQIPADRYKANFGQQHTFHVSQTDYRQSPLPIRRLFVRVR